MEINKITIKRVNSIKFLGVLIDENIAWKKHINEIEKKVSKGIGMLYKAKFLLNRKCLKDIYYAFIHSYLNYANISWVSTNPNKLNKLHNKQKYAARSIFNEDRMIHARPLLKQLNILNIYQLNIYQILTLMFKTKLTPNIFFDKFKTINLSYPTTYSTNNCKVPKQQLKISNFCISTRGPTIWNNFLNNKIKSLTSLSMFQKPVKNQLFCYENEISLFL